MNRTHFFKKAKLLSMLLSIFLASNAQQASIIPYPNSVEMQSGSFTITPSTRIYYDRKCKSEAMFLQHTLAVEYQVKLQFMEKQSGSLPAGAIYLTDYY